ncbi:ATP-binding cassette domain-containing protein [Lapillicoccus sp.]|uniref:ABC transporter ATP-binding protein n=1 Tax=Lapillicoccus sp. TaxID=1909287 RepID=UPI00398362AA
MNAATVALGTVAIGTDHDGDLAIATCGLSKRFGTQTAVDALGLVVPTGSVYGFLGPNGSGKTTTIRMLLGLVQPTSGTRTLLGCPIPARAGDVLPRVGALVEGPAFHPYLSGRSNLARLDSADLLADPRTARTRIDAALDRVGLLAAATKRYRAYSLGMRQRLAIAGALLVPRDLLVLDEPTNGLDPQGTREVRHLIGSLAADGATVFVSSHLLSEVEQMCSHLGVMSDGRLVAQGTSASVRGVAGPLARVSSDQPLEAARVLTELGLTGVEVLDGEVRGIPGSIPAEKIVAALVHDGVGVRAFSIASPSLEDLFVSLTGEGFDVSG